jgi:sodium/potassium-transporting ATPase subunit alpha
MRCALTHGKGVGIVFSTGEDTFYGEVNKNCVKVQEPDSNLNKKIKNLILKMSMLALSMGLIILILSLIRGYNLIEAILFSLGIVVMFFPESLNVQQNIAYLQSAKKMFKKNIYFKKIQDISTLASVDTLVTNKTGTLTCNSLSATHLCYDMKIWGLRNSNEFSESQYDINNHSFRKLIEVMVNSSTANFKEDITNKNSDQIGDCTVLGDSSEAAMIKFLESILRKKEFNSNLLQERKKFEEIASIPFSTINKWTLNVKLPINNQKQTGGRFIYYIKGAPEKYLVFARHIYIMKV